MQIVNPCVVEDRVRDTKSRPNQRENLITILPRLRNRTRSDRSGANCCFMSLVKTLVKIEALTYTIRLIHQP